MHHVDTNIVLRYLLQDIPEQTQTATDLFDTNEMHVSYEVLAETVYVLISVYKAKRAAVSQQLQEFLVSSGVLVKDPDVIWQALVLFGATRFDFVDCVLAARSQIEGAEIHTFDKDLRKLLDQSVQGAKQL